MLKDAGNKVADQFGAERTPEVFVLDKDRVVRYHGRVDDQYGFTDGVGYQRPEATRDDLAEAINELVAGKEVSVPATEVVGCKIGRVRQPAADATVTYSKQIAPRLSGPLRRMPSSGPDRPVCHDQLRRSCWLGRDDSRGGRRGPHATLACRQEAWQVFQRPELKRRGKEADRGVG